MLFNLLELAGNKALEHDAASLARLQKLRGKTMTLHIKNLSASITVTPQAEGLEFSPSAPEQVDVTLITTIGAMIKIGRDGLEDAELEPGELEMSGDPIVGQRFAQVMADLNIDWEALLTEQIGAAPAHAVTTVAGQAKEFVQESRGKLHDFVGQLIKDDLQIVVGEGELNSFLDGVDDLRADVDRLGARLERLLSKTNKAS